MKFISAIGSAFQIDPRSFFLFRIILGVSVLIDLTQKTLEVEYLFSELGVMSSSAWQELYGSQPYYWSFHLQPGALWVTYVLLAIQFALVACLIRGVWLRPAFALSAILMLSLILRNPIMSYGGEKLLTALLLIGAFLVPSKLPVASKKKNAAAARAGLDWGITKWGGMLLAVQVVILYCASGVAKMDESFWQEGTALFNALHTTQIVKPIGIWMCQFEGLLQFITKVTPPIEAYLPLLILVPFFRQRCRTLAILMLLGLNLGIYSILQVAFFMPYASAALIGLLPTSFWEDVLRLKAWACGRSEKLAAFFARAESAWQRRSALWAWLPKISFTWQSPFHFPKVVPQRAWYITRVSLAGLMALMMISSAVKSMKIVEYKMPTFAFNTIRALNLYQNWGLFVDLPPYSYWWVAKARLTSGEYVDLYQDGAEVEYEYRRGQSHFYQYNNMWQRLTVSIGAIKDDRLRNELTERYSQSLIAKSQRYYDEKIESVVIYQMWKHVPIEGKDHHGWKVWGESEPMEMEQVPTDT